MSTQDDDEVIEDIQHRIVEKFEMLYDRLQDCDTRLNRLYGLLEHRLIMDTPVHRRWLMRSYLTICRWRIRKHL